MTMTWQTAMMRAMGAGPPLDSKPWLPLRVHERMAPSHPLQGSTPPRKPEALARDHTLELSGTVAQ
jgi:hypothetical protein